MLFRLLRNIPFPRSNKMLRHIFNAVSLSVIRIHICICEHKGREVLFKVGHVRIHRYRYIYTAKVSRSTKVSYLRYLHRGSTLSSRLNLEQATTTPLLPLECAQLQSPIVFPPARTIPMLDQILSIFFFIVTITLPWI
jgi:hypothetical protein